MDFPPVVCPEDLKQNYGTHGVSHVGLMDALDDHVSRLIDGPKESICCALASHPQSIDLYTLFLPLSSVALFSSTPLPHYLKFLSVG